MFFLNTVYTMNIHERHVIMSGEYFQMCLDDYVDTSRSANAERPRDASCLLVVIASTVQYVEPDLLLLVTSASDLPLRTIKFCSVTCVLFS